MNELNESPSKRNFTMISRKLHALFMQYIEGGRIRAPPEADLTYLISTFQNGAKTDRRALQSKFKSWAKRMVVENHALKLISTGKEIIPEEDSCKIVMRTHFQGHLSVELVIKQIQETYTWTKKNFGMDRKMVMDTILKNCNNLDCIETIKSNEAVRNYQCENFIKDVIFSSESRMYNQQNVIQPGLSKMANSSSMYSWPIGYSLTSSLCAINNSFQSNLKISSVKNMNSVSDDSFKLTLSEGSTKNFEIELKNNLPEAMSCEKDKSLKEEKPLRVLPRSFRKPKNILDLKSLLNAAEQFNDYPAVLCNPKTKFLGSFGLAPKRICSKRTLSKFEKEKKKKAQDLQNMSYHQNRKYLRDRNKLNKIKLKEHLEKRAYLDKFKNSAEDVSQMVVSKGFFDTMQKGFSLVNDSSGYSNSVAVGADESEVKIMKVVSKSDEPEVIDIDSSSDDESNCIHSIPKHKYARGALTISMNSDERKISMKSHFDGTETVSSRVCKIEHNQQFKKTSNNAKFTSSTVHPEAQNRYYPMFKQPYLLPSISKSEVAILPSPQYSSMLSVNRHATKPVKFTKAAMQGKKPILQPIPSVNKVNLPKLPTPGITSKIPNGTSVYLMHEQPSGVIKMVPYKRVVATSNPVPQRCKDISKKGRPISVNTVNAGIPIKAKYRSILPAPNKDLEINRQRVLDTNKLFLDGEMTKLSTFIGGMKSTMSRNYFQLNVQRSKHRLESQLNAAIDLVKNIRRKLIEIEKLEEQVNKYNLPKNKKNVV